jgi:hypothetical protein
VVPAVAEASGGEARYFIRTDANRKDAHVSMAIKGQRIESGYFTEKIECKGYPDVGGNFIDFGHTPIRNGHFRDVDRKSFYRDRVSGSVGKNVVRGRARSVYDFTSPGPICRTGERFTLDLVDRSRWKRYTKQDRELDPSVNGDHRERSAAY